MIRLRAQQIEALDDGERPAPRGESAGHGLIGLRERADLLGALEAGAAGFVVKDTPAAQLAEAVRRVHQGLRVVDPSLAAETLVAGTSPLTGARTRAEAVRISLDNGWL
jgi:hypothetical protein